MIRKNIYLAIVSFSVLIYSCKPEIEKLEPSSGSANLSNYVAVGNSITAGYADGALFKSGQEYAYPNIMAQQFALAGGGKFNMPFMKDDLGFPNVFNPATESLEISPAGTISARRIMGYKSFYDCQTINDIPITPPTLSPVLISGTPTVANFSNIYDVNNKFNNFGIPGATVGAALFNGLADPANASVGRFNPYFARIASSTTATIVGEAVSTNPTFFTYWLGNNDVLGYATSGGGTTSQPTPVANFSAALNASIDALTANGAKGAIATIPDITALPFFTTVPAKSISFTLDDSLTYRSLNSGMALLAGLLGGTFNYTYGPGNNPFPFVDNMNHLRVIEDDEFVLLTVPQDKLKCGELFPPGSPFTGAPLINGKYVLEHSEIDLIQQTINQYNSIIKQVATNKGLALVDANAVFNTVKNGAIYDGVSVSNKFVTGGLFSLDGVHPTPRGQAIIANEFIKAINKKFGASIPTVNVVDYPGVKLP